MCEVYTKRFSSSKDICHLSLCTVMAFNSTHANILVHMHCSHCICAAMLSLSLSFLSKQRLWLFIIKLTHLKVCLKEP